MKSSDRRRSDTHREATAASGATVWWNRTPVFNAHGCCANLDWRLLPLSRGGHWASDSNAVKITCPLSLRHSKEKAAQLSYRLPFFLDYMREPRRSPDPSDSGEEKRRQSRNGPALPPFPFFVISEWCLGFVRKMASVIFIQQQSTASFSLGLRVAMATPAVQSVFAEDTHSTREACVRLTNRKVSLCLLSAAETHNRLTSDMRRGADGLF